MTSEGDVNEGQEGEEVRPRLHVVRGEPTPEELAVLTALVTVAGDAADEPQTPPTRGGWNDPFDQHRRPWLAGPGGWRAAGR